MNSEFKFWCPVDIKKAVDEKTGEEIMLLGGIASTADEDSDGEFLDPKGFNIKPLIEKGLVNWHHQAKTNPGTIVGEPTKAEIRKDGLYIETKLYPSSPVAVDIWNLAKTLEADSNTRRLGYSIEGKVVERKSENPSSPDYKKITKAIITGVAITHMPKNPKTFANIIKGDIDDISDEPEDEEVKTTAKESISSKDENENEDEEQKDLDTESGSALKRESVDGEVKITTFSKSEVFELLFKDIPGIEIEKAEEIYLLIHNISSMAKKKSITNEDIVKAYDALGLDASNSLIAKADAETEDAEREEEETEDAEEEEVNEPEEETTVDETDGDEPEEEETEKKSSKNIKKGNLFGRFDKIEKAVAVSHLNQTKYIKALGTMVKAQSENLEKAIDSLKLANEKIDEQSEIIKGYENEISELSERLERYGSGGAAPRSIRHAQAVERNFDKGIEDEINKGGNEAGNRVSIKNHSAVAEILDQATFAKGGYDDEFSKACMHFEATKDLPANIISRIKSEFGVEIVK